MTLLPLVLLAAPLQAAPAPLPQATCPAIDADLPAPLKGWSTTGTGMAMDRAFLLPAPNGEASANFTIAKGGRYRVALDQAGWIDLVQGGKPLTSAGHGHGPSCTTIRKIVDFDLTPGAYTLKLTKIAKQQAKVMLVAPAQNE
ncbi:hypothetical protein D1610_14540 [Sphingomonas gilva]|uniref:Homogentisate 1,2-dioxygenase n=2 Tax=Sphingomonas gilva TaxID=2305907 RepID=A0A396RQZ4_9SPHN|nr:hypothetical protein D1610_14540 [Sphingomonas gilva]